MFKIKCLYFNSVRTYSKTKNFCNLYRVYKNPKAKDLFLKAQQTKSLEEREKLYKEMGDYTLLTEPEKKSSKNRFLQFIKGLFN